MNGLNGLMLIQTPFVERMRTDRINPKVPAHAEASQPSRRNGAPTYPTTNAPQYESLTRRSAITTAMIVSAVRATVSRNAIRAAAGTGFSLSAVTASGVDAVMAEYSRAALTGC